MTPSERLLARLRGELGLRIPDDARIERTRAGLRQREAGAWSWYVTDPQGEPVPGIGSAESVTALLARDTLACWEHDGYVEVGSR